MMKLLGWVCLMAILAFFFFGISAFSFYLLGEKYGEN
jgi:hypothetical protein